MSLRLFNTRTGTTDEFVPLRAGEVGLYVCGLTPSAEPHLGHARSFLFFDVLRRYLVHLGYRVTYVRNVTDIDDRSIATAAKEGTTFDAVVERYFSSFSRSMERLHLLPPDREPRATAYVAEILAMIAKLIEAGHAYVVDDGIYYAVRTFARYGALSGRNVDELEIGARIEPGESKRDALDFALWKFAKPGEPSWPSAYGAGRPGWHIECSAMSEALLGAHFDIHGGGYDLIFPHHENEIAQSEPLAPGAPMANVWLHGGLLNFDGKKMSKSLGNFEPLSSLLDRHDPQAIRLLFLQTGYRKPMNFTEDSIAGATTSLARLYKAYDALRHAAAPPGGATNGATAPPAPPGTRTARARESFAAHLDDDMNTAGAISVVFDMAKISGELIDAGEASFAAAFVHEALDLLGLSPAHRTPPASVAPPHSATREIGGAVHEVRVDANVASSLPAEATASLAAFLAGDAFADLESFTPYRGPQAATVANDTLAEALAATVFGRVESKAKKNYQVADEIRRYLEELGVTVRDGKSLTTATFEPRKVSG